MVGIVLSVSVDNLSALSPADDSHWVGQFLLPFHVCIAISLLLIVSLAVMTGWSEIAHIHW